jgi:small GTP-binding protein
MSTPAHPTLHRRLTPEEQALVADERRALGELERTLAGYGISAEHQTVLRRSIEQLDALFLLVVVGEFNAGKSAFVNALVGARVLQEGATPTTTHVTILAYGETSGAEVLGSGLRRVTAPVFSLQQMEIVDTPGTNAVIREHEQLTSQFVPRADLVLFVTSADRPFTESERLFLEKIRDWGKKIVVVVNKADILDAADVPRVREFVLENARKLLGQVPELFLVSARDAFRAKAGAGTTPDPGFADLEHYISTTLDDASRLRLKLQNPLGVGRQLLDEHAASARERRLVLAADLQALDDIDRELKQHESDMARDFALRMTEIEHALLEMERRGHEYFDETLRVGRLLDLLDKARVRAAFEHQVVADTPDRVERHVRELIDWMVEADLRQWEAVTRHIAVRQRAYRDRIVGLPAAARFQASRARLVDAVAEQTRRVVDTFDRQRESEAIAQGARNAVAGTLAMGAGALGLGTLVTAAATTAAADFTGLLTAGLLAAVGLFVIPAKRRQAKEEMKRKVTDVRTRLSVSLNAEFREHMQHSAEHVRGEIAPYARFVRGESAHLDEVRTTLERLRAGLESLRARVDAAFAASGL